MGLLRECGNAACPKSDAARQAKNLGRLSFKMADVPDIDLYADDLGDDFHGVIIIPPYFFYQLFCI